MPIIDDAASLAEKNELPVVEGFAVEVAPGFEPAALLTELGPGWARGDGRWLICRFPPKMAQRPTLGEAWTRVRELQEKPGIRFAEPLLVVPSRPKTSADARRLFGAWGWVSDQRDEQIARNSQNLHWAPNLLGCPRAWDLWEKRYPGRQPGDGVLIAQLDTGYTRNPRVLACLQRDHGDDDDAPIGLNFVGDEDEADRQRGALDPLPLKLPLISNPGHGTKIASVIAADRAKNRPWGTAPGARILPLRVSRSVIHMSFQNVCDAFTAAIERPVHIISMSLGGPFASRQLFERVQQALDAGIIVVAAAGNDIPGVVFPARVPGVIACAACNALEAPWRLSGLGSAVTITAPGELVWHEEPCKGDPQTLPAPKTDNGTSYATAQVAGLAALWLSYHGRDALIGHCGGDQRLLPYLFRHCLTASANSLEKLAGFGFGAGLANAETLLEWPLADPDQLRGTRDQLIAQSADMVHFLSLQNWQRLLHLPTFTADLPPGPPVAEQDGQRRLETFFEELLDQPPTALDLTELACLAGADPLLGSLLARIASDSRHWVLPAAIRRYLLRHRSGLSSALARRLDRAQGRGAAGWLARRPDALALSGRSVSPLGGPASPATGTAAGSTPPAAAPAAGLAAPRIRRLKAFAFDPSLQTSSRDVRVNEITIPVTFERLLPGPVGDYLEVVDVDPASACAYAPVDLDHPWLLAQDGLDRSESSPQFHQQMVYAVAMKTIGHFEEALGRPIFWSPLRPRPAADGDRDESDIATPAYRDDAQTIRETSDQFVRRLRLYPHALRAQNAYYSPAKRAILFGYFPAGDSDPGSEYPGGLVFTCLAHDIVAHEMTHAILDGMHHRFIQPTNPDVYAFHEAFADIVALFQRFTYRELVEDQIARARGQLDTGTLMTQLALQFGQATGRHHALRDALGYIVQQVRETSPAQWRDLQAEMTAGGGDPETSIIDSAREFGEKMRYQWKRFQADPLALSQVEEPHARGSFLVAAVFDAYLTIYEARIADLKRIASGGTGILPDGDLHPDLVRRMAHEATQAARHVLRICIRGLDYLPPVDLTFGEYLRALITADSDLVPDDPRRYRVAFIEAFRKWGIYPRDVKILSEQSLRWARPPATRDPHGSPALDALRQALDLEPLRRALMQWRPGESRESIFEAILEAQRQLHEMLEKPAAETMTGLLGGIDTRRAFEVCNLRPARRIGPAGSFHTEMVVEIVQHKTAPPPAAEWPMESGRGGQLRPPAAVDGDAPETSIPPRSTPFSGGATLIVNLDNDRFDIRYAIYKRLDSASREKRQREFLRAAEDGAGAAEYGSQGLPDGWFSSAEVRQQWRDRRNRDREAMRASSCFCRRQRMTGKSETPEPFALLHRR